MAVKLQLKFGTVDGVKTWSFAESKTSPSVQSVKNLVNTIIANGSIYKYVPLEIRSASTIITTENVYDLEDE